MRSCSILMLGVLVSACGGHGPQAAGPGDGTGSGGNGVELGPPHGTVDPTGKGGDVNLLSFTAFGDVRPALPDEDFAYPNDVVTSVMKGMAALAPEFAIGTGDYMFVEYLPSSASGQLQALLAAEKSFSGPIFHGLGNHECQSFTDVNCPNLNESTNITTFMSTLVPWTPVPWFSFVVHTALGDAKFVFVAVNAWTDAQAAWLEETLAQPTRYTFVVRHHPTPDAGSASSAAGVAGSDAILSKHPVTLFLFGHVHEYAHLTANAVISGNAGAPLDSGHYGYLGVVQRSDGNVAVTEYDASTNMPTDTWAVTPEGTAAP